MRHRQRARGVSMRKCANCGHEIEGKAKTITYTYWFHKEKRLFFGMNVCAVKDCKCTNPEPEISKS